MIESGDSSLCVLAISIDSVSERNLNEDVKKKSLKNLKVTPTMSQSFIENLF